MNRIVAAVDGSEASNRAVDFAAQLAARFGASLTLVDVVEHNWPPEWAMAEYARPEQDTRAMAAFAESIARDTLKQAEARAIAAGATRVQQELRFGDPVGEILTCRDATDADTIVVGSRGHGRLSGLLLGSVSQKIILHAPCTVIVVR